MPVIKPVLYKIVRYYAPDTGKANKTIKKDLTLAEAQAHCSSPTTQKAGVYFDGYTKQ